jgi:2-aminoethylphosphonate transport system substrate-binding protein
MRPNGWMATVCALAMLGAGPALAASDVVTVYSVDGLHEGTPNWYETQFGAFTEATGIKVIYLEGGAAGIVDRLAKEASSPKADVLVTLPPFIQQAAAAGLLQPYTPAGADQVADADPAGFFIPLVNNYMDFIYNGSALQTAPRSFEDLLDPRFKSKLQYSTPGQTGDGTAVLIQVIHAFGGKDAGFGYLKKLQGNNIGPAASTGKLTELVQSGELDVANGDLQMNMSQLAENPDVRVFWPAGPDGVRSTFAIPYCAGLVRGAPDAENGRKLIDFLLSREAQMGVSSMAIAMPVRKDVVPTDATYKKLHAVLEGVTIWTPDWAQIWKDLPEDVARWREATGG